MGGGLVSSPGPADDAHSSVDRDRHFPHAQPQGRLSRPRRVSLASGLDRALARAGRQRGLCPSPLSTVLWAGTGSFQLELSRRVPPVESRRLRLGPESSRLGMAARKVAWQPGAGVASGRAPPGRRPGGPGPAHTSMDSSLKLPVPATDLPVRGVVPGKMTKTHKV